MCHRHYCGIDVVIHGTSIDSDPSYFVIDDDERNDSNIDSTQQIKLKQIAIHHGVVVAFGSLQSTLFRHSLKIHFFETTFSLSISMSSIISSISLFGGVVHLF